MALEAQHVPVPLSGGVDTRTNPQLVAPPKLGVCENAVFTTPGQVRKRQGYAIVAQLDGSPSFTVPVHGDGVISSARALATRGDELVMLDATGLLTNQGTGRWNRALMGGNYAQMVPASVTTRAAPKQRRDQTLADRATSNGVTVYVWAGNDNGLNTISFSAVEAATGRVIQPITDLAAGSRARVLGFGGAFLLIWAPESGGVATGVLNCQPWVPPALNTDRFTNNTIQIAADLNTTTPIYDAVLSGSRVVIAYNTSTASTLKLGFVDMAGNADGSFVTQATASAPTVLCVAAAPAGFISPLALLVAWGMNGNNHVDARAFDQTKTALFAATTINVSTTNFVNMCATAAPDGNWYVLYESSGAAAYLNQVYSSSITNGGSTTPANRLLSRHSGLASKPWIVYNATTNGFTQGVHVLLVQDSTFQSTYFVLRLGDNAICARLLPGIAGGVTPKAHLPQAETLATQPGLAVDGTTGITFGLAILQRNRVGSGAIAYDRGVIDVTIAHATTPARITLANALYVAGGILCQYDGSQIAEHGFLLFPENVTLSQGAGGSLTLLGSYSYRVYFEWINALGQREISTALTFNIAITGANQTVQVTIPTLAHTMRSSSGSFVSIVIYRTAANPSTTPIYYRVSNPSAAVSGTNGYLANDRSVDTLTFTDQMSDATLITQEPDYLSAGVIDNVALPACTALAVTKNRAWAAISEDPDVVWPSKMRLSSTAPLEWSDVLPLRLPSGPGPVTGIATMQDVTVIFRDGRIYVSGGDGPDNTGQNGSFAIPRTLADDIGCTTPTSIVRIPTGIIFMSRKGFYHLAAADQALTYVGADVEAFNGETVTSAVLLSSVHEARFGCASGKTLVYNYLAGQWSVFTAVGGVDAVLWQNRYTYLPDTTGAVRAEVAGQYQDNGVGYSMAIETGWLHIAGLLGFQRVRELEILGDFKSSHRPRVRIAYDLDPAWVDDVSPDISAVVQAEHYGDDALYGKLSASVPGVYGGNQAGTGLAAVSTYQFSVSTSKQKCSALKVRIEDTPRTDPTGANTYPLLESYRLTELSLLVAGKAGLAKPGADRTF